MRELRHEVGPTNKVPDCYKDTYRSREQKQQSSSRSASRSASAAARDAQHDAEEAEEAWASPEVDEPAVSARAEAGAAMRGPSPSAHHGATVSAAAAASVRVGRGGRRACVRPSSVPTVPADGAAPKGAASRSSSRAVKQINYVRGPAPLNPPVPLSLPVGISPSPAGFVADGERASSRASSSPAPVGGHADSPALWRSASLDAMVAAAALAADDGSYAAECDAPEEARPPLSPDPSAEVGAAVGAAVGADVGGSDTAPASASGLPPQGAYADASDSTYACSPALSTAPPASSRSPSALQLGALRPASRASYGGAAPPQFSAQLAPPSASGAPLATPRAVWQPSPLRPAVPLADEMADVMAVAVGEPMADDAARPPAAEHGGATRGHDEHHRGTYASHEREAASMAASTHAAPHLAGTDDEAAALSMTRVHLLAPPPLPSSQRAKNSTLSFSRLPAAAPAPVGAAPVGTKRARDEAEHEAAEDGAPSETSPQTCGKKMVGVKRWM